MKIIYIAHPVGAVNPESNFDAFKQVRENMIRIRKIVRELNLTQDEVVPFVPYYVDIDSMSDWEPVERARGIKNNIAIMQSGCVDELWLYGDRISPGMLQEINLADHLGIPVVSMSDGTKQATINA